MIDLYLHVGLGKTGSTYLQSLFASNMELFKCHGILYPVNSSTQQSGNGHLLYSESFLDSIEQNDNNVTKLFFSREHFARELAGDNFSPFFNKLQQNRSIRNIYVLLFVRNAFDHCYSLWSQKIKNTPETRSFRLFSRDYNSLSMASEFIKKSLDFGLNIRVLNYSSTSSLESAIFAWIDPTLFYRHIVVPESFVNVSPSFTYLNRIRLLRRFPHSAITHSTFFKFLIFVLSSSLFKPRKLLCLSPIFRYQIDQVNSICFNSLSIMKQGFSKVSF